MKFDLQEILKNAEGNLSPFAVSSANTLGRVKKMPIDPFRLEFSRDANRILHSPPFRRLKHKTQVFLSPGNDHICTRMEHVLHVSSIATVIGRCLGLNQDLITAIALGHDLGHAPFGHAGEKALDSALKKYAPNEYFMHEVHGLRVVDSLTRYGAGLNLTYEVRDGIISHNGERFMQKISPERNKDLKKLSNIKDRSHMPATLEGCLVRMADIIAYLGRDIEDAIEAGLIKKSQIPSVVKKGLGDSNGKIIGRLVSDVVEQSMGKDSINLSKDVFSFVKELKKFNYKNIYYIQNYTEKVDKNIADIFDELMRILDETKTGKDKAVSKKLKKEFPSLNIFFDFIKNTSYNSKTPSWRIVTDYIAGMTDAFARKTYNEHFLPNSVI